MINVAICDIEEFFNKEVFSILSNISKKKKIDVTIDIFEEPDKFLAKCTNMNNEYNIVFINVDLNININNKKGIDIAREIKKINNNIQIIFFSRTKKYIFEGYDIGILNYLLKPTEKNLKDTDKKKIETEFLKALNRICKIKKDLFCIKKKDSLKIIDIEDILFFEANNRKITVVTKKGKIDFYDKIQNLEEKLSSNSFIRCHRGFLVNPEHIKEINKDTLLLDYNYNIPISRLKISKVKSDLINYLNNNNKIIFSQT